MMEIVDLELEGDDLIEDFQFPETLDAGAKEVDGVGIGVNEHLPKLHESGEPERSQRNGRYNMRKSLAWDSAFFTSAGVLDPEELSCMITKTDNKKEKRALPGIQEDISGSTESISTLQSDSLTLESGEDDLFLDIRASIQRSSKKGSNFANSGTKIPAMELDGTAILSPKKEVFVSQNKIPRPGMKKNSTLQTVRMSKSQLKPIGKLGLGRPLKQDPVQSQVGAIGKTRDMNSVIPKPLKAISSSVLSTAAKRESVGIGRVKSECGSSKQAGSVPGKLTQVPKVSALGGSRKVPPKPAVLKSSSLGSSMTSSVQSTRSSTSSDSSINTSSGKAVKPTLMTARRNLGKSSNISTGPSGSGSIPKTPSKAQPKNKLPASTLSTYLKSTKISSSVSPASSISEWSSVSSTTSSVVNQRSHNTRSSFDTSSCRSLDEDNSHLENVSNQKAERQGNQGAVSSGNTSRKSSTSGSLQAPGKPSGLRLPSPKIGFFDGSTPRTPNGNQRSQSSLHPVIPKSGAATSTPTRSSNGKLKNAKGPMPRTASSLANMKAGSPKVASPSSSQGKSRALVKASNVSTDKNDSSSLSLGVKVNGVGEIYPEAGKVEAGNGNNQVVDAHTHASDTDNSGDFCLNKNMSSGDIKTATVEGNYVPGSEYVSEIGDGLIKDEPNKNSIPSFEAAEKDNNLENCQGEGLVGDKIGTYQENDKPNSQLLIDTTECVVSSTADAFDALENISYSDECVDMPKKPLILVTEEENTASALPSSDSIQTGDGLTLKPMNSTSEAIRKDNDPAHCQEEELTGEKRGIYQKNDDLNSQLPSVTSECPLSSASASDATAYRPPFAPKNFFDSDEYVDKPKESTGFALLPSGSEYFSQVEDGLAGDELKKNSAPTSGDVEKENNPAVYQGNEGLTGENGINDTKHQPLIDTSECLLSSPFALKNPPSSNVTEKPMEPVIQVALPENAGLTLPTLEERDGKMAESNS